MEGMSRIMRTPRIPDAHFAVIKIIALDALISDTTDRAAAARIAIADSFMLRTGRRRREAGLVVKMRLVEKEKVLNLKGSAGGGIGLAITLDVPHALMNLIQRPGIQVLYESRDGLLLRNES
jgi:hypothetical protein